MTRRAPYRVGMARPAQRVIEPDAIYYDLRRGSGENIPREFPYSWTPVNGLGDVANLHQQGVIDDTFSKIVDAVIDTGKDAGKGVVDDTTGSVEDRASQGIMDLLGSGPGQMLLDAVEERATKGVTEVVKKNAPHLILLSVAAGSVGGAVSGKLGKAGTIAAILVAGWAAYQLMTTQPPGAAGAKAAPSPGTGVPIKGKPIAGYRR